MEQKIIVIEWWELHSGSYSDYCYQTDNYVWNHDNTVYIYPVLTDYDQEEVMILLCLFIILVANQYLLRFLQRMSLLSIQHYHHEIHMESIILFYSLFMDTVWAHTLNQILLPLIK